MKQMQMRLQSIESTLRITTTAADRRRARPTPHPASTINNTAPATRRTGILLADEQAIGTLVQRYISANQRRSSVIQEKEILFEQKRLQQKKTKIKQVCQPFANQRFHHFTRPTLLLEVPITMGGTTLDARTTVRNPTNPKTCIRTKLMRHEHKAKSNSNSRHAGLHAGNKDYSFLMTLTSYGYVQCWTPCTTSHMSRLNDPFRKSSSGNGGPSIKKYKLEMNGMAYQGFVEIDALLDWSEGERKANRRKKQKDTNTKYQTRVRGTEGKESTPATEHEGKTTAAAGVEEDLPSSSSTSSSSSSSSEDDDDDDDEYAKDVIATGCFIGAGVPWWSIETKQTKHPNKEHIEGKTSTDSGATGSNETAPTDPEVSGEEGKHQGATDNEEEEEEEEVCRVIGVVHHVFVVGIKNNRLSISAIKCRPRHRHATNGNNNNGNNGNDNINYNYPTSEVQLNDTTYMTATTLVTRDWSSSLSNVTNNHLITTCSDFSSRDMIVCGAGPVVLGISSITLETLFSLDLKQAPILEVDQATANSMIVWRSTHADNERDKAQKSKVAADAAGGRHPLCQHPKAAMHVQCDDATGMVVVCTNDGKTVKVCLKMTNDPEHTCSYYNTVPFAYRDGNNGDGRSNSGKDRATREELTKHRVVNSKPVEVWSTLICNEMLSKELSFMSTIKTSLNTEQEKEKRMRMHSRNSRNSHNSHNSHNSRTSRNNSRLSQNSSRSSSRNALRSRGRKRGASSYCWSSFISDNGGGYSDINDVTLCIGDGATGVRILIMSQENSINSKPTTSTPPRSRSMPTTESVDEGKQSDAATTQQVATATSTTASSSKKNSKKSNKRRKKKSTKTGSTTKDATAATSATSATTAAEEKTTKVQKTININPSERSSLLATTKNMANNSTARKKNTSGTRRNIPLHPAYLWLPENFASHGVVKIDRMVEYDDMWEELLVENVVTLSMFPEWKANASSPDGRLVLVVCCVFASIGTKVEGKEGKESKEGKDSKESMEKTSVKTLVICWDVINQRLLSSYDLSVEEAPRSGNIGNWTMSYDLRSINHSTLAINTTAGGDETNAVAPSSSSFQLRREFISVDPIPYIRSPHTQHGMKKLLMNKTIHVATLRTPTRWCK